MSAEVMQSIKDHFSVITLGERGGVIMKRSVNNDTSVVLKAGISNENTSVDLPRCQRYIGS